MSNRQKTNNAGEMPEKATRLRMPTLVGLIVANMIGAGVFTTSGFALADLGSPDRVMLAWLAGGVIAVCGAASYGALVRHFSESGGEYLFLSRALHPAAGFVAGWISLLAGFTGAIAFAALAFETYFAPSLPVALPAGTLAIALVVFAAALHGVRLNAGVWVQNAAVALKVVLIVIFLFAAAFAAISQTETNAADLPVAPPFSLAAFAGSLVWISLSYSGFNAAVYVAGEARDAERAVPRAMLLGAIAVTILYLALNAAFLYFAPFAAIVGREDVAARAAQAIGGDALAALVRAIIAVALLTSVFAMIMAGPRVYAKMADDRVFPAFFRFRGEVPRRAIILQAAAAIILILFSDLKNLLSYLGFTLSLCAALTVFCLFLIRRSHDRPPVSIIVDRAAPAVFVGATVLLATIALWRNPWELLGTLLTVLSGGALYLVFKRRGRTIVEP